MVVTVGLSIMLRNMFLFQFGGRTRPLRDYSLQEGTDIGPITITHRDLVTAAVSLVGAGRGRLGAAADPARQGDAGGVRTTPTSPRRRASTASR